MLEILKNKMRISNHNINDDDDEVRRQESDFECKAMKCRCAYISASLKETQHNIDIEIK